MKLRRRGCHTPALQSEYGPDDRRIPRRDRQLRIWIAEAALSAIGAVALAFLIASPLYVTAHDLAGRALWLVVLFAAVLYFYSIARAFVLGYHAVHDAAELQLGEKVWHLTSSEELVQQVRATGRVHLDIEKTRWPARVKYRSRPWKLPKKAAFVFLDQPTDKDQWLNLSDKRARTCWRSMPPRSRDLSCNGTTLWPSCMDCEDRRVWSTGGEGRAAACLIQTDVERSGMAASMSRSDATPAGRGHIYLT